MHIYDSLDAILCIGYQLQHNTMLQESDRRVKVALNATIIASAPHFAANAPFAPAHNWIRFADHTTMQNECKLRIK